MIYGSQTTTDSTYLCARDCNGCRMLYRPFAEAVQEEKGYHGVDLSFPLATEHLKVQFMCSPDHRYCDNLHGICEGWQERSLSVKCRFYGGCL